MKKINWLLILLVFLILGCKKYDSSKFFRGKAIEMADAIDSEDFDAMEKLAKIDKLNLDTVGEQGMTFLLWSFITNEKQSMQKLLELGANPNLIVKRPPINIKLLQKMYPDSTITVNSSISGEVIYFAKDNYEWIDLLAKHNTDFCKIKFSDNVLFSTLVSTNRISDIFYLLDKGMDVNCRNNIGSTIALQFALFGRYDFVYKLLERGADLALYRMDNHEKYDYENEKNILTPYKHDIAYLLQNGNTYIEDQLPYRKKIKDYLRSKGYKFPKLEQWEINAGATESYEKRFN